MPFKVVIPARYASSRLPGKPLLELAGPKLVLPSGEELGTLVAGRGGSTLERTPQQLVHHNKT